MILRCLHAAGIKIMNMAEAIQDNCAERREARRYRSPEGIFLVENADNQKAIGDLLDISDLGLAFIYSTEVETLQESNLLNIVSPTGEVHIEKIPYNNMNDFDYVRNYPFDAYRLRRRGVRFSGLDGEQKHALQILIKLINAN
jgi:hypothetical protein